MKKNFDVMALINDAKAKSVKNSEESGETKARHDFCRMYDLVNNYGEVVGDFPKYKGVRVLTNDKQEYLRGLFDDLREQLNGDKVCDFRNAFRWSTYDGKFLYKTQGRLLVEYLDGLNAEISMPIKSELFDTLHSIEEAFSDFIVSVFMPSKKYQAWLKESN